MAATGTCIILSIRREHAKRIFDGSKLFELRKRLPNENFKRVYLYQTGGGGIVGCFDPSRVLRDQKGLLWDQVNWSATTKARFERYFERSTDGYAIEVSKPVKFKRPLSTIEMKEVDPKFHVPMSSRLVPLGSPLGQVLERYRRLNRKRQSSEVILSPIATAERAKYRRLVTKYVGARYEGIDDTFAARTLEVHDIGHDPSGFFTDRKEVFSIWIRKEHIGFTTITWKNNGCAKTGPTIIEPKFQGRGFGRATRKAIEVLVRKEGYRKIYCTCADNAPEIASYLLDSGMKLEAHLDRQYSGDHGEFVFGKFLIADEYQGSYVPERVQVRATLINSPEISEIALKRDFKNLFSETWTPVTDSFADRIVRGSMATKKPDPRNKSKRMVCIGKPNKILGLTVLLPKRGGAVKALLATATNDDSSLRKMIDEVCRLSCRWGSRKIYFLHPLLDITVIQALRESQFQMEGFLRAPYKPGQDVGIFSRFC